MAKKAAVKKDNKLEAALEAGKSAEAPLGLVVKAQADRIEALENSVRSLQGAVDQVVSTFQRKFPYG